MNVQDIDDFASLKEVVKENDIKSIEQYKRYCRENIDKNYPEEPDRRYRRLWTGWYDFLSIDISIYPKTKEEWIQRCRDNNVKSVEEYLKECERFNLPKYPSELYSEFSTLTNEFNNLYRVYRSRFYR